MLDPISVLGIATTAFNTLKKGFELGKDAESMIKDVGRFMHSVDDIKNAHKSKKKGKIGSVEEESLETYVALKKAKQMNVNTISILGNSGGKARKMAKIELLINEKNVARIQEAQKFLGHYIFEKVENILIKK